MECLKLYERKNNPVRDKIFLDMVTAIESKSRRDDI